MTWIVRSFVFLSVALIATAAPAALVNFSYTQADSATGLGTIGGFTYNDGGGNITFAPTPMPAAVVRNPVPGSTPVGFIGAQTAAAGDGNEQNVLVGLTWTGSVLATGTRGANVYTMEIPLQFAPEQSAAPDTNDYTWSITYGDNAPTLDTVSPGAMTFAMWFGRDPVVDNAQTANTFQRYTQLTHTFTAGANSFSNTDTVTAAIKDATDAGDPQGFDAAGQPLAFYYGWRTGSSLTSGAVLINDMTVGGLLVANENTLRLVPEPSTFVLGAVAAAGLGYCGWRRRRK